MAQRTEIQSKIDAVSKELALIEKRRAELAQERDRLNQSITARTAAAAADLLAGKTLASNDQTVREKQILESIDLAILQAENKVNELTQKSADLAGELVLFDFKVPYSVGYDKSVEAIRGMMDLIKLFDEIKEQKLKCNEIKGSLFEYDEFRDGRYLFQGFFHDVKGQLDRYLGSLESGHNAMFEKAKTLKSK